MRLPRKWLYPPSPADQLISPSRSGYYNGGESGHHAIDVAGVVVVTRVAVVVHIHEVRAIGQVGRTLPPIIGDHPAWRNIRSGYSQCLFISNFEISACQIFVSLQAYRSPASEGRTI